WETFRIAEVRPEGDAFCAFGTGWQLMPPQRLQGEEFEAFRRACGYFIGFRRGDQLPYRAQTQEPAEQYRPTTLDAGIERFCDELITLLPQSGDARFFRGFVRQHLGRNAEAVVDFDAAARLGTEFAEQAARCRQQAAQGA